MVQLLWTIPLFGNVTLTVATLSESLGPLKVTERCGRKAEAPEKAEPVLELQP